MVIQPKIRGFICTSAHPDGCFESVQQQVEWVKKSEAISRPKKVLIVGASTGYGLASRIACAFGANAATLGVSFEKATAGKRTASTGWYNLSAFQKLATEQGMYAKDIIGDAFSHHIKDQTMQTIKQDLGQIDLFIYSLASPRRIHPDTEQVYSSALKTTDTDFTQKTVDAFRGNVSQVDITKANEQEIHDTIQVMGGEDWQMWVDKLLELNLLATEAKTVAYSYIGPELTYPVYKNGTIGKAKDHLHETAVKLNEKMKSHVQGEAVISVNKAVVTQSSAAIPVVPLYISILFKIMKEQGTHEGCIEQCYRLLHDYLYNPDSSRDEEGRIRLDDKELDPAIQQQVADIWQQVNSDNIMALTDLAGYRKEFYHLFGFDWPSIDYTKDTDPHRDVTVAMTEDLEQ